MDTGAETWSHQAAANPDQATSLYEGTAETGTLMLVPLAQRPRRTCAPSAATTAHRRRRPRRPTPPCRCPRRCPPPREPREVQTSGAGDTQVQTRWAPSAASAGDDEHAARRHRHADHVGQPWLVENEPDLPRALRSPLRISVDGTSMSAASPTDLTVTGRGCSLAVRHIMLDPAERHDHRVARRRRDALRHHAVGERGRGGGGQFEGPTGASPCARTAAPGARAITVELDPRGACWSSASTASPAG